MTFSLTYELDVKRIISAVINDSRNIIPETKNRGGFVIYDYAQAQISQIVPGVLLYRISTGDGGLGGYTALQVQNGVASVLLMQLRPAFIPFLAEISQIINNFIGGNLFLSDMLY